MGRRIIAGLAALGTALGACTSGSLGDNRQSPRSLGPTGTAPAGVVVPADSNAYGRSIAGWQKAWVRWAFTTSGDENPLLNPTRCGEIMDGVFFLTAAIASGLEADCTIPAGVPILVTAGGGVSVQGLQGDTREELLAHAKARMDALEFIRLSVDGTSVPLDGVLRFTSAYTVDFEEGNFFDQVGTPVKGNRLVASAGYFVRLRPPTAGVHTIVGASKFTFSDILDFTFHVTVPA